MVHRLSKVNLCWGIIDIVIRLTITDYASRYLIACDGLESTRESTAFTVYENVFKEFGLPRAQSALTTAFRLLRPIVYLD
jgi:hypothetical protein